MVFFSQPLRAPRLFWLLPDGSETQTSGLRAAIGNTGIALSKTAPSPPPLDNVNCLRLDIDQHRAWSEALTEEERDTHLLLSGGLPSQIAATAHARAEPVTIMLDIVMGETTDDAWEKTERLIEQGLPARTAASALIGTAQDIAGRIESYRSLGIARIVLTAPPERAPYEAVARTLLPLLGQIGSISAPGHKTDMSFSTPHVPGLTALAQIPT